MKLKKITITRTVSQKVSGVSKKWKVFSDFLYFEMRLFWLLTLIKLMIWTGFESGTAVNDSLKVNLQSLWLFYLWLSSLRILDQSNLKKAQREVTGYSNRLAKQETTNEGSSETNPPTCSEAVAHPDIHCHRNVLSSHSPYFKIILATEIPGDGNQIIETQLSGNAYGSELNLLST